ncbi:MAG: hypothetical protein R3F62_10780 [Planctomycetota bacterium]
MRTLTIVSAFAMAVSFGGVAIAQDTDETQAQGENRLDMPKDHVQLQKGTKLPGLKLINEDGEELYLDKEIADDEATVIKFFDVKRDPTFMAKTGEVMRDTSTPFTKLYEDFKDKDVNWVFVAVGETEEVRVARETWESAKDEDVKEELEERLAEARAQQFEGMRKFLEQRKIEDYALYVAPLRYEASEECTPSAVIVRGKDMIAHVAAAGDEQAITNLTSELHLAVNDPAYSGKAKGTLPASAPRETEKDWDDDVDQEPKQDQE